MLIVSNVLKVWDIDMNLMLLMVRKLLRRIHNKMLAVQVLYDEMVGKNGRVFFY